MNQSHKHHFLPKFYLKGFTNINGQFSIFNIKNNCPKQNGKSFYPSSHFFEINANTIDFHIEQSDFIEKIYVEIENKVAKIISLICKGDNSNRFNVSEEEMPHLNNFVSQIYWRNPSNEIELKNYISKHSLRQLGLKIIDEKGKYNSELSEQFKNEPEFYKSYKLYTSFLDSLRGLNCRKQYHIFERPKNLPVILSDNPIIFPSKENIRVYEDDYIFPLSKNRTFIKRNLTERFNNELYLLIDLIQIKQSKKYFAYTDLNYVKFLESFDYDNNLTIEEYKAILFETLQ